ncbi:MAG: hypothetical protein BWX80_03781 [Candidatus Hydrogenedentes bacterium ADurb.Bin101]|nr:MAG: hypothetical protein BWX80_03781 [Candidatus Hydrogenedentes bacterium ADurb.Bin101]
MSRVQFHGCVRHHLGAIPQPGQFPVGLRPDGIGVCAGMQFDRIRARLHGSLDLTGFGINKHADPDTFRMHGLYDLCQTDHLTGDIQPSLGRNFFPLLRDQTYRVRLYGLCYADNFVLCGHFQVHIHEQGFFQGVDILVLDMPAVLAKVDGNLMRPGHFTYFCGRDNVRAHAPASLTQRGDMVYVYTQCNHWILLFCRLFSPVFNARQPPERDIPIRRRHHLTVLLRSDGTSFVQNGIAHTDDPCHHFYIMNTYTVYASCNPYCHRCRRSFLPVVRRRAENSPYHGLI